jgi:hypothetical protein
MLRRSFGARVAWFVSSFDRHSPLSRTPLIETVHRFLLLTLALGLVACTATNKMMFDQERKNYVQENELTEKDSVHVVEQKVYRGMPVEHALAALGTPNRSDTTATEEGPRIRYVYESRPNAFDPGNKHMGYLFVRDGRVTDWEDLKKIPRLDAYSEGGM